MARMAPAGTEHQLAGMLRASPPWDATLCVLHSGFPMADALREHVEVVELDGAHGADPRRALALRRLVAAGGYDVVHSSLWGANAFTRAALAGSGRPAVVVSERRVEDFRPAWQRRVDAALRSVTQEWIGNSLAVVDFVVRAHGAPRSRVHHIPNGLDGTVFSPASGTPDDGAAARREVPRLGCLGRLVPQKGFEVALAAVAELVARRPVELHVAGQGPERASLERAAQGLPVTFRGHLGTPGEVASFLRELDVLVVPSRYEGLPNVVLEALACGTRVVAADAPGVAEATVGQARLVDVGDAGELAGAVEEVLTGRWQPTPGPSPAQSFEGVAAAHGAVFEAAVARRQG